VNCENCRADRLTIEAMAIFGGLHRRVDTERPWLIKLAMSLQKRGDELCSELRGCGVCQRSAGVPVAWAVTLEALARLPAPIPCQVIADD